jgi:serine/threonine protein kinase
MITEPETIGRYKVVERIGRGGMGVLYRGTDSILDREVAIKVMSAEFASSEDEEARGRFFREACAAAKLQHRNIVTIFEFAEEHNVPYIVMEFLRGRSLQARMLAGPPLTLDEKLDILTELCAGLQFAHENGVVHRDVKPGNVWLLEDGSVKLLDFGIAKTSSSTLTRRGDVLGSASYMSPEQVTGAVVDGRADIFSAAIVLYELLAGVRPFLSDSPTSTILKILQEPPPSLTALVPGLPAPLVAAVEKGLQKDPNDRYQTAGEFGAELQLIRMSLQSSGDTVFNDRFDDATLYIPKDRRAEPVPAPRQDDRKPVPLWAQPRWLAMGAGLVAIVLVAVLWSRTGGPPPEQPDRGAKETPGQGETPPGKPDTVKDVKPEPPRVLKITSEPSGASIVVDGKDSGLVTPYEMPIGDETPRRVQLSKKGFRSSDVPVTAALLTAGLMTVTLAADVPDVRVSISSSYPVEVYDGRRKLAGPSRSLEVTVPSRRVLRLSAPEQLLDYPFRVEASSGRSMEVEAPELGKVTIRTAMETCRVLLDGQDLGYPPLVGLSVAAGTYAVQLKCPDGRTIRGAPITVQPGDLQIAKVP